MSSREMKAAKGVQPADTGSRDAVGLPILPAWAGPDEHGFGDNETSSAEDGTGQRLSMTLGENCIASSNYK